MQTSCKKKISLLIVGVFILSCTPLFAQNYFVYGNIKDKTTNIPISKLEIYEEGTSKLLCTSNQSGNFQFFTKKKNISIIFFSAEYKTEKRNLIINDSTKLDVSLKRLAVKLNEIEINAKKEQLFSLIKLNDVVETSIYAGKKSEVILLDGSTQATALNNARQLYNQVSGLNIYQNDDAGLQLNIGGRGLDPSRTSNFNTRKNGYDISADVLGYPESYYTPPAEALERIEIIRGAASLQYGTQFGGLINFVTKQPNNKKKIELITRNTIGSNNLITNFTSISGKTKKTTYYSFYNFKKGNGFRSNSSFLSKNIFTKIFTEVNSKISISIEYTYLDYLAQQAGGLTDNMFNSDPYQSNRTRNWFSVKWNLYNLKIKHKISEKTNQEINIFGLNAQRDALGFRSNRADQIDPLTERDLINGVFKNYGFEYRILNRKTILKYQTISLLGCKLYKSNNNSKQGPGSDEQVANFNFQNNEYPYYPNQSEYKYPNLNISFFGENIIYINKRTSITPGFRFEHINTQSEGYYKQINLDGALNPIWDTIIYDNNTNERNFFLFGIGISHKLNQKNELYANGSQNYRSVTFSDISIINPTYVINPNITDEHGYTLDLGIRGNISPTIYYDITSYQMNYKNRIGFIQKLQEDGNIKSERGNIGDARIFGLETLIDFNLKNLIPEDFKCNFYINSSFIESLYTRSEISGIEGKKVELIPKSNIKSGLKLGYKNLLSTIQYTYLSKQFTDATNSENSNMSGIIGSIPAYNIIDLNFLYNINRYKIEFGINNLLNNAYFTRRATGYPGPGIIPSPPRNYYLSFEIKI